MSGFPDVRPQRRRANNEEGAQRLLTEPGHLHPGQRPCPDDREDRREPGRVRGHGGVRGAVPDDNGREGRGGGHERSLQRV